MTAIKRPKEVCKDCWSEFEGAEPEGGWAPAPQTGPRCFRHRPLLRPREVCKDCWVEFEGVEPKSGWRPTTTAEGRPIPGPRCATHARIEKRRVRKANHDRRLEANFQMPDELYWALYAFQGGKCFVCRVATGKAKALAVDHDHECDAGHPKEQGCPRCWRALICGKCNQMIGFLGIEALCRAIQVLAGNGPARQLFVMEVIDSGDFDQSQRGAVQAGEDVRVGAAGLDDEGDRS